QTLQESLQTFSSTHFVLDKFEECMTSDLFIIEDFKIIFVEL
ncbi:7419_t:CDS:1, partial [Acaulospora morrowiae]